MSSDRQGDRKTIRLGDDEEPTRIGDKAPESAGAGKRDRPYFIVLAGTNIGKTFKVGGELVIGRSSEASVRLEDDGVSRRHARVFSIGEELWIEDLGSANGTIVNGESTGRRLLQDGDKIQFGAATILKFTYHDELDDHFQQRMYDAALYDGLTKAHNKRAFFDRLATEVAYARRHGTPLTLLILDVDHFKQVNDRHGHLAGDHVLTELARLVNGALRVEDCFARYGGEEFAVLCRGVKLGAAAVLAERLRSLIATSAFDYQGQRLSVTISVGVSAHSEKVPDGATQLVSDADGALYDAKRGGRDRVVARTRAD
jgi:two-component system cell cycle response regulator